MKRKDAILGLAFSLWPPGGSGPSNQVQPRLGAVPTVGPRGDCHCLNQVNLPSLLPEHVFSRDSITGSCARPYATSELTQADCTLSQVTWRNRTSLDRPVTQSIATPNSAEEGNLNRGGHVRWPIPTCNHLLPQFYFAFCGSSFEFPSQFGDCIRPEGELLQMTAGLPSESQHLPS